MCADTSSESPITFPDTETEVQRSVGHKGAELPLDVFGITMLVPEGALESDQVKDIGLRGKNNYTNYY